MRFRHWIESQSTPTAAVTPQIYSPPGHGGTNLLSVNLDQLMSAIDHHHGQRANGDYLNFQQFGTPEYAPPEQHDYSELQRDRVESLLVLLNHQPQLNFSTDGMISKWLRFRNTLHRRKVEAAMLPGRQPAYYQAVQVELDKTSKLLDNLNTLATRWSRQGIPNNESKALDAFKDFYADWSRHLPEVRDWAAGMMAAAGQRSDRDDSQVLNRFTPEELRQLQPGSRRWPLVPQWLRNRRGA